MKRRIVSFALIAGFAGLLGVAPAGAADARLYATLPTTGMHIHLAPTTSPGPVVVPFSNPTTNQFYECKTVENEALLDNIAANPGQYYYNVHNAEYPGGFIRGQLQAI